MILLQSKQDSEVEEWGIFYLEERQKTQ
jgi:hypothetical protein